MDLRSVAIANIMGKTGLTKMKMALNKVPAMGLNCVP